MTVRTVTRRGERRQVIDIPYKDASGRPQRYRRDAQVQTRLAALAEERRLLARLGQSGELPKAREREPETTPDPATYSEVVRHYRTTRATTQLKPSTRLTYLSLLDRLLLPRFGDWPIHDVDGRALSELDAELVADGLTPSSRRNVHVVFRAVLRCAADAGMLPDMPKLPRMPKVGRSIMRSMHRDDLDAILAKSGPAAKLAIVLAAFAGLRASEVRGLCWSDVDLKAGTITVRRAVCRGVESTPKSHHARVVPIAGPLLPLLQHAVRRRNSRWSRVALTSKGQPWGESGLRQALSRAQKRAGREGWTFHSLRRFFVTELFRQRASAPAVQALAGHADLSTTQRYAVIEASDLRSTIALFDGNVAVTAETTH